MSQAQTSETHPPGFYWHVHHEILLEWCYDYPGRVSFIRREKEAWQVPIRLRFFTTVKGALPQEVIQAREALGRAWKTFTRARGTYDKADKAFDKADKAIGVRNNAIGAPRYRASEALGKAREAFSKTWEAFDKAGELYNKAGEELNSVIAQHMPAIEALHRQEHPDCPWDGKTIFPKAA